MGLLLTPGLGLRGLHRLLDLYTAPEAIYRASLTELEACQIPTAAAQSLHDGRSLELGVAEAERARLEGIDIVTLGQRRYPQRLREIYDPPAVLYVRGDVAALDRFSVAVVGTRQPTLYGRLMAEKMGRELAHYGLAVVSGLARGIDGISQKACLEAGGVTAGVLGSGIDVIYPRENMKLAEAIITGGGALVSEFPMGCYPAAANFPVRNRTISGLALGVLIIEGGEYSGSRITAGLALEQNREVFAIPGQITQKQAWLPNVLIKQGAKLVTSVDDIVEELPSSVRVRLTPQTAPKATPEAGEPASPSGTQGAILNVLARETATHVDEIADRLENRLSAPEILTALFDLEMAGFARQLPGKCYVRVR